MSSPGGVFRRSPHILWRDAGAGVLLADPGREDYELLSETAAAAWDALDHPMTVDALTLRLAERYGAAPEAIREDVAALVGDLVNRGAVTGSDDG